MFPAAATFLSKLSAQSLQSGNQQCCPRLEAMGLVDTVDLENSLHRSPVTPGNLKKCFAAFDLMAHHLGLLFLRLRLALGDFDDGLHS